MYKKYKNQINELIALGIRDLEQNGSISIREITLKKDGSSSMFPSAESNGVSLNLISHCTRLNHKKTIHRLVLKNKIAGALLISDRMITQPADLVNNQLDHSLYVLCIAADGKIVVRQDYTIDGTGKVILGEKAVLDHDPEDGQADHGVLAEGLLSLSDEMFEELPQENWTKSMPQEWIDYVYRERKNRNEDEWYSPDPVPESSETIANQGGHHEVLDTEETV